MYQKNLRNMHHAMKIEIRMLCINVCSDLLKYVHILDTYDPFPKLAVMGSDH